VGNPLRAFLLIPLSSENVCDQIDLANQCSDCNENGYFDLCDILFEFTACDLDLNDIPDTCQTCHECLPEDCGSFCPEDGTWGNGTVTINDVIAVVAAFGPCGVGVPCPCDIKPPQGDGFISIADVNAVVTAFGLSCTQDCPRSAPPVDTAFTIELVDFSEGYPDENGDIQDFDAEVAAAWEDFSEDYVVYRLWVTLEGETDTLDVVTGDDVRELPLIIDIKGGSIYNHGSGGNKAPNPGNFETYPELAFDTFITLGSATSDSGITIQGTLNLSQDVMSENVGWYKLSGVNPVSCREDCWRVLVAQFAITEGAVIEGAALLLGDGIDEYATFSTDE
jgi:hypothetical protein